MAKVGYLILCEDVISDQGKELIIRKPYIALTPISIPGNYSFTVAFSLFELVDGTTYDLDLSMHGPSQKKVFNERFNFEFKVPQEMAGKVPYGQMSMTFPNFPLMESGTYQVSLSINGENTKMLEVPVHASNL